MRTDKRGRNGAELALVGRRAAPPRLLSERLMQALVQETEEIDFHGMLGQAVVLKQGEFIRQVATTAAQANLHIDHCVATAGLPEEDAAELRQLLVAYLDHARRVLELEQDRSLLQLRMAAIPAPPASRSGLQAFLDGVLQTATLGTLDRRERQEDELLAFLFPEEGR